MSDNNFSENIQSLDELVSSLSEGERTKYSNILTSTSLSMSDLEALGSWSDESYTRNCVFKNDDFELILLCWEKDQITPIHDHGGEECWVYFLNGEFKELIYKEDESGKFVQTKETYVDPGAVTYMVDFMGFHNLKNVSGKRSMTLHVYANPIKTCQILDEATSELSSKEMKFDTVIEQVSH